jgi:hypothetical protein
LSLSIHETNTVSVSVGISHKLRPIQFSPNWGISVQKKKSFLRGPISLLNLLDPPLSHFQKITCILVNVVIHKKTINIDTGLPIVMILNYIYLSVSLNDRNRNRIVLDNLVLSSLNECLGSVAIHKPAYLISPFACAKFIIWSCQGLETYRI